MSDRRNDRSPSVELRYRQAVVELSGKQTSAEGLYEALSTAYLAPDRAYHNLDHIGKMLDLAVVLGSVLDPRTMARLDLSIVYHDVVYDPSSKDNESMSAEMARRDLSTAGLGESDLDEIERLIMLTREHRVEEDDLPGVIIVDADLAILQSTPDEYDRYAMVIRKEYAFVPDEQYRPGRIKVLEALLSKRLFRSPFLNEEAARANMQREIANLRQ